MQKISARKFHDDASLRHQSYPNSHDASRCPLLALGGHSPEADRDRLDYAPQSNPTSKLKTHSVRSGMPAHERYVKFRVLTRKPADEAAVIEPASRVPDTRGTITPHLMPAQVPSYALKGSSK